MMQFIATIAVLLTAANAAPLRQSSDVSSRTDCTLGQFYCNGTQQWAICSSVGLQYQSVAAGTLCMNGAIVAAGSAAGSAAPVAASSPVMASSPVVASSPAPVPTPQPPTAAPAPVTTSEATAAAPVGTAAVSGTYKKYTGDGSTASGWPAMSDWCSFDAIWAANKATLSSSCTQFLTPNNSDEENQDILASVQAAQNSTGVDARFILAIIMQESKGCVRVWSTSYSVTNPGLMQSHSGKATCNSGISSGGPPTAAGVISNPCPKASIELMVQDGTAGTSSGDGLKQLGAVGTDAKAYYTAARKYNSGSVAADGDLSSDSSVATKSYASDVANRLLGYVGNSQFA